MTPREQVIFLAAALEVSGCETAEQYSAWELDHPEQARAFGRVARLLQEPNDAEAISAGIRLADELPPELVGAARAFHDYVLVARQAFG